MRPFPTNNFSGSMLRKFPAHTPNMLEYGVYPPMGMYMDAMNMQGMPMNFDPRMMMGGVNMEMVQEMDQGAKRDFYGERLYNKISSNPSYAVMSDYFSKIVGIFLDLEEPVIDKLIHDDNYFDIQVRETMRLLAERQSQ